MSEESLCQQAMNLPPEQRAAFLDRECPDPVLRARIEAQLAAEATASPAEPLPDQTTSHSLPPSSTTGYTPVSEVAGAIIAGRYQLRQQIGEGGMGTVWLATQTEPIKRQVAVKLIRVERGQSKTILARFEAERQAIALMDHPHIAKLLDAGTTETGEPFFVMELVKGIPLNEFCDQHKLTIPERLNLFVQICSAVQHAHQKGIIHRDLKPSNILVESHDGKPVPKVIDFGLAKATTGLQLTEHSLHTGFGAVLGTPLYMAPEQATFNAVDVDTRADVYALGVILYELLTGTTPITRETLKKAALDEMLRLIREQEAPTPSSRLSSSDHAPSVAANRQIEPAKLGRFIKGELDWIVMKALSKERDRRYETANGFARDIERFLNHEPVSAGPPTAAYRIRKFLRRHRGPVLAASLVLLALIGGVIGTTIGLLEARRQAGIAREQQAEATRQADLARAEAEAKELARAEEATQRALALERLTQVEAEKRRTEEQKRIATAVNNFLQKKLLAQADTATQANEMLRAGGLASEAKYNPTIRELLDRAAKELAPDRIEANFREQPLVQAQLLRTVGDAYRGIGEAGVAIDFLTRCVELFRRHVGPDHPDTLTSMNNLAVGYQDAGKLQQALPLYEETLKLTKAKLGPDHPSTLTSMGNLARGYQEAGKLQQALPLFEETLKLTKAKLGPDHPDTLRSMNNLALGYQDAGKLQQALPLFEETLKLRKAKLGPDHPDTLISMDNLAAGYQDAGKLQQALPLYEETLKLRKAKLGPDHPDTLTSMNNLALGYQDAGKLQQALPLYEETLKLMKAKLGPDHPDTLIGMNNLALGYQAAGKLEQALPLYEETLKLRKAKLGPDHPDTLTSMNNLASGYQDAGKLEQALPLLEETLKLRKAKLGPDHPSTLTSMNNLATGYKDAGKLQQALPLLEETLKLTKAKLGPDHPDTLIGMNNLAAGYHAAGKLQQALPLLEETLKLRKAKLGPDHPATLTSMNNLATGYKDAGKLQQALPLYEETLRLIKAKLGPDHPHTLDSMNNLAAGYWSLRQLNKSVPLFEELLPIQAKKLGREHPDTQLTVANLGVNYKDAGRLGEAIPLLEEAYQSSKKHPSLRWVWDPLLDAYAKAGKPVEAKKLIDEMLADARKQLPKDSPQLAGLLAFCGLRLLEMKAYAEAEPLVRECLTIREKKEPEAWTTFDTQSLLGGALLGQKKYAEAEPLLLKGYDGLKAREKTIPPQGKDRLPEALDRLIELYTATNKPEEVNKYQALRAKYPSATPMPKELKK